MKIVYRQRGTLQLPASWHIREWSSRSCHMRLQGTHPPGTLIRQLAKCLTRDSSPLHAGNLHGPSCLSSKALSCGPIVRHPSLQIWTSASMASRNCPYTLSSSILRAFSCLFWDNIVWDQYQLHMITYIDWHIRIHLVSHSNANEYEYEWVWSSIRLTQKRRRELSFLIF